MSLLSLLLFSIDIGHSIYITMEEKNLLHKNTFNLDKILLFDIDGTLYKISKELEEVDRQGYIRAYETLKTNDTPRSKFITKESIYLQDMYDELGVTPRELNDARGDIHYGDYVEKDDRLVEYFSKSKYRLWCFTNGLKSRAEAILKKMEIERFFEGVICTDDYARKPVKKPYPKAYEFVEIFLGVKDKSQIFFFDDLKRNITPASERGWNTFLVRPEDDLMEMLLRSVE